MVRAWFMDESADDQRLPHRLSGSVNISLDYLERLGVKYWYFEPADYSNNTAFNALKSERGYSYEDLIEVSPKTLNNYEKSIKSFYDEHIHTDEEIRYVLDGSGYFDVRDTDDKWIRIELTRGDMIVLPAGIYHRFTLDENNYIKALRLFQGEPVWTPYSRSQLDDSHPTVEQYKQLRQRLLQANSNAQSVA